MDSDSDDQPLVSKKPEKFPKEIKKPVKANHTALGLSDDSDVPLDKKLARKKIALKEKAAREAKAIRRREETDHKSPKDIKRKSQSNGIKKEDSDDDIPIARRAKAAKQAKKVETPTPKKRNVKREETDQDAEAEAEEAEYKWWEDPTKGDGTKKWSTLEHNGVVFPPPYQPLPKNVKLLYDGTPVNLAPKVEEVAGFFGSMLNSAHNIENPTFQKNFFSDFKQILKETGGAVNKNGDKIVIKEFQKCDFKPIFDYYDAQRVEKKALPAAEKKRLKAEKDEAEAPYLYCQWDGRKQKVGNFRVEPPGLFRGRGEHPKTGHVKKRVDPEQITINIGKEAKVPSPPEGHRWKAVKHDQEGTWLAMWQENINNAYKYVMLAANSDIKGQSDFNKFEKARELKKHIDRIRKHYEGELKAELTADRQRATAMYLIDQFALRAGNEKGDDEAETVGCCSLKFEHVTLRPPNTVIFDFLGKDSIRFYNEVQVTDRVFKNLKIFKKAPKGEGDDIFDRLTTSALNKHLSSFMPGLTAKVFRTYNASYTMSNKLKEMHLTGSIPEKIKDYNEANREVAILCNHKRTIAAGHETQMEKMGDRIKGMKYQKWRTKQMMLDIDPSVKKKKKRGEERYFELDEDLDRQWIQEHQAFLVEEQRQKIKKKFDKDNEKLAAEAQKEMKPKELDERLAVARELEAKFKKENKTGKVEAEGRGPTVERCENQLQKLDQRIETAATQAQDKESNKEVALGTSKIVSVSLGIGHEAGLTDEWQNYIDPRLTVVFSKKFDVPIEKLFSKTLREKFDWAIKSVDEKWSF